MFYVAVDVGCIECGEKSAVLGIFENEEDAVAVGNDHAQRQSENWHGQHSFEVFSIEKLNTVIAVGYKK